MKISLSGNNLIKNPQFKGTNKTKLENPINKYNNDNIKDTLGIIACFIMFTCMAFEKISKGFKDLTKFQKVARIAKWGAKISVCTGIIVLCELFQRGDLKKIIKKQTKAAPVQNNVNNLNYKSDVFADFDLLTSTTVNK